MSSVRSGPFDQKNTTYIVTGASLVNDLVTYTQSLSAALVQVGTFAAHANAALVTQGYLLVDTGKRLVPGQQPNVPTLLIGVNAIPMDTSGRRLGSFAGTTATTISGFIDPNSPNVAIYSRDRPTTFNDNLYFSGAANLQAAGDKMTNASLLGSSGATDFTAAGNGAGVRHRGPGVFSGGALTAAGGSTLTASVTNATYVLASGLTTYTAANTFTAGQLVTITGLTATGGASTTVNLINAVIATASATQFTVNQQSGLTAVTSSSGPGTATANLPGVVVTAGGVTVNGGGLNIAGGPIVNKISSTASPSTPTQNLDLASANIFYYSTGTTGNTAFTITNAVPGMVFTVAILGVSHTLTFPSNVYVTNTGLTMTTGNATPGLSAGVRYLFTCVVVA